MINDTIIWLGIGLIGQGFFSARFILQWLASERKKCSVIPVSFWYLSISGSVILLSYACYKRDPVFILGQLTGCFIYVRNLFLISQHNNKISNSA